MMEYIEGYDMHEHITDVLGGFNGDRPRTHAEIEYNITQRRSGAKSATSEGCFPFRFRTHKKLRIKKLMAKK